MAGWRSDHFEFNGGFPRSQGCPQCGVFGFPDGYDSDGTPLYYCERCGSYPVESNRDAEDEYWREEDKYEDWERYYDG